MLVQEACLIVKCQCGQSVKVFPDLVTLCQCGQSYRVARCEACGHRVGSCRFDCRLLMAVIKAAERS